MSPLLKKTARLKFLLDENVDVRLTSFLRKHGYFVLLSPKGLTNGAVVSLAGEKSCILLTNDKDFANLELITSSDVIGIVVFRIHPPELAKLESALKRLFEIIPPEEFVGKVLLLSEEGVEIKE